MLLTEKHSCYCLQCSCSKVMFSQASVILFMGWVCVAGGACMAGGGCVWHGGACVAGVCMAGGMHDRGCMVGGVHDREACVAGGMHGRWGACIAGEACMAGGMCGRRDDHCSGWYASYWNAFMLLLNSYEVIETKILNIMISFHGHCMGFLITIPCYVYTSSLRNFLSLLEATPTCTTFVYNNWSQCKQKSHHSKKGVICFGFLAFSENISNPKD